MCEIAGVGVIPGVGGRWPLEITAVRGPIPVALHLYRLQRVIRTVISRCDESSPSPGSLLRDHTFVYVPTGIGWNGPPEGSGKHIAVAPAYTKEEIAYSSYRTLGKRGPEYASEQ